MSPDPDLDSQKVAEEPADIRGKSAENGKTLSEMIGQGDGEYAGI